MISEEANQMEEEEEEEEEEKEKSEMNYPNQKKKKKREINYPNQKKKKTLYVPMAIPYTYSHASAKKKNTWDTYTKNQSEKSKTHGHLSKLIKI